MQSDLNLISLHNDQVRLAQELMTKANYLLETSKDLFIQPLSNINDNIDIPPLDNL